jgi:malonyl CoA-acyl carrier protein transacylase
VEKIVAKRQLHDVQSEQAQNLAYWLGKSVQERIEALEQLRAAVIGAQPHADQRLQRVCRITQLKRS